MNAAEVIERLSTEQRRRLQEKIRRYDSPLNHHTLTPKQLKYVEEYTNILNGEEAARRAGYVQPASVSFRFLNQPQFEFIRDEINKVLIRQSVESELRAEYVRQVLKDAIDFQPLSIFTVNAIGELVFSMEKYEALPDRHKRLVEVDIKLDKWGKMICVPRFIDKMANIDLAARFTLVQKLETKATQGISLEDLANAADVIEQDEVNARLADYGVNTDDESDFGEDKGTTTVSQIDVA